MYLPFNMRTKKMNEHSYKNNFGNYGGVIWS